MKRFFLLAIAAFFLSVAAAHADNCKCWENVPSARGGAEMIASFTKPNKSSCESACERACAHHSAVNRSIAGCYVEFSGGDIGADCGRHWGDWADVGRASPHKCPAGCTRGDKVGEDVRSVGFPFIRIQHKSNFQCWGTPTPTPAPTASTPAPPKERRSDDDDGPKQDPGSKYP